MSPKIIEMKHLYVSFNGHPALEDINLEIDEERFVGILGPNGGGKSSLLKVVLGLLKPTRGEIRVFGQPPEKLRGRGKVVGYLPQKPLLNPKFPASVLETVMMGRYGITGLFRRVTGQDRQIAMEKLRKVGIAHLASKQIGELSGGEQQRLFIARALCVEPRLLLLDEPTVFLDACMQDEFYELIRGLKEEMSLTVLMVCHDLGAISRWVDDIICINRRIHIHQPPPITRSGLESTFGCRVEYLFHGQVPHRVVKEHND